MTRLFLLGLLVLLLIAWMGRYEISPGSHGLAYKLDRWTGQITYLQQGSP